MVNSTNMYTNAELERHGFHIEKAGDLESKANPENEEINEEDTEEENDNWA